MGRQERTLFFLKYPEFKVDMCVTGWTWIPCPIWSNPGRLCKQNIKTPCKKTRESRFRVYAYVTYPDTVEEAVEKIINDCHLIAASVAADVIITAVAGASAGSPASQIAAGAAAIPVAISAYGNAFWNCLSGTTVSSAIKSQISYDITHETKKISDWH
ncbi:hypothetical protein BOY45_004076 [Shigella flexneri]|nr:hypothetical protein [Shigella flexneri]